MIGAVGLTRDEYHRYRWNGGDVLPSVTTVIKLQDTLGGGDLAAWGARLATEHLLGNLSRTDPAALGLLQAEAIATTKAAANTGTEVHDLVRRVIVGEAIAVSPTTAPYLAHFAAFLAAERPEFVAAEELIANLTVGYAGQFDFIARIRGKTAICDVKTGKAKPTFRLQLAAYQEAEFIGKPGDPATYPMPVTDAGFVLLLRPTGYELVPATPTKADRAHFRELAATYHKARRWADASKATEIEEEEAA